MFMEKVSEGFNNFLETVESFCSGLEKVNEPEDYVIEAVGAIECHYEEYKGNIRVMDRVLMIENLRILHQYSKHFKHHITVDEFNSYKSAFNLTDDEVPALKPIIVPLNHNALC